MIEKIFNACVAFLLDFAHLLGTDYKTINVVIFCILEPIIFILMVIWIVRLKRKLKQK